LTSLDHDTNQILSNLIRVACPMSLSDGIGFVGQFLSFQTTSVSTHLRIRFRSDLYVSHSSLETARPGLLPLDISSGPSRGRSESSPKGYKHEKGKVELT